MIKKLTVSLSLGLILCPAQSNTTTPEWVEVADSILASVTGFTDALAQDAQIYTQWQKTLQQLQAEFDKDEALRNQAFTCIKAAIIDLQTSLASCQSSSAAAAIKAQARERDLLQQLTNLKQKTAFEIQRLNELVKEITNELTATRTAYNALSQLDEEKSEALSNGLCDAYDKYEIMIEKRSSFLEALNAFIKRTQAYLNTSMYETHNLQQQFCKLTQD